MKKQSVAGIVLKNRSVFIAKRIPGGQMGERWEFPGGKVENGELPEVALQREYMEEFGVDVTVGAFIGSAVFTHNGEDSDLLAYEVSFNGEEKFTLSEHTETGWSDIDEIPSLNFVDSDMLLYKTVKDYVEKRAEK